MNTKVLYDSDGDILEVLWEEENYRAQVGKSFDLYFSEETNKVVGICLNQVKKQLYKEGLEGLGVKKDRGDFVNKMKESGVVVFNPFARYHPIQDCIDVYWGSERCYVESIAKNVDLFLTPRTDRIVGCKIYGISELIGETRVDFKKGMKMIDGDTKIYFKCKQNASTLPDGEAFYSFEFSHNIIDKVILSGLIETFLTIRNLVSNDTHSFHFCISKMIPETGRDKIIENVLTTVKNICKGYDFVDFASESKE